MPNIRARVYVHEYLDLYANIYMYACDIAKSFSILFYIDVIGRNEFIDTIGGIEIIYKVI